MKLHEYGLESHINSKDFSLADGYFYYNNLAYFVYSTVREGELLIQITSEDDDYFFRELGGYYVIR